MLYREGQGCEQSYERAAEWYEKAARQGLAVAMNSLGFLYEEGQGVPQSYERAAELYKQSVALGETVSQRNQAQFQPSKFKQHVFKLFQMNKFSLFVHPPSISLNRKLSHNY